MDGKCAFHDLPRRQKEHWVYFFTSKKGVWAGGEAIEKGVNEGNRQQFRGKELTERAGEVARGR